MNSESNGPWGVVTLFYPPELPDAIVQDAMGEALAPLGITPFVYRDVPMNLSVLGARARRTAPRVVQAMIRWNPDNPAQGGAGDRLRTLQFMFKAQRRLEDVFRGRELPIYIVSCSDRTIVYKGMMEGRQFAEVFTDLHDPEYRANAVVFHRRFATNTSPVWNMCQPFRVLCHNGEINTIQGNRHGVHIWERYVSTHGGFTEGWPATALIPGQSDSADLDGAVQAYHAEGRSLSYTVAILMPPSWENRVRNLSLEMKAFFEFHKRALGTLGAWEGPAAILAYDGEQLVASLDRMGLRPLRVSQRRDGLFLAASENGIFEHEPDEIVLRAQLIPGDIVRFDFESETVVPSADVYFEIIRETRPRLGTTYRETNHRQLRTPSAYGIAGDTPHPDLTAFRGRLGAFLRAYGWDSKLKQASTDHLIEAGKEDIYSMGYDRAMPFLSVDGPTLYRFFFQRFALVTNPPIDPYREGRDMSLVTYLGRMPDVPPRQSPDYPNVRLKSPILTEQTMRELEEVPDLPAKMLRLTFNGEGGGKALCAALDDLIAQAADAASESHVIVLSDIGAFKEGRLPIPAPLAVAALNEELTERGLRAHCSIVVQTGEVSEGHDVAVLLALGANAVHPHALMRYAVERAKKQGKPAGLAIRNTVEGLEESLRKIMSKMGIATVQGYHDSCLFEAVGLGPEVMRYLPRVPSRIGGLSLDHVAADASHRERHARTIDELPEFDFDERSYNDPMRIALWEVSKSGDPTDWRRYQHLTDRRRPCTIRDLLEIRAPEGASRANPLSAEQVLSAHFTGGAMSHGALTRTAHEAIAYAANRLGMPSNSGEGGEDRARNKGGVRESMRSRIRQVATGRFGVDAEYLVNADEIQIKMAQGAKPGEGGQLMSSKVTPEIAALRYCRPGINLISPPPHHDIYSIEDLKQLIYDLRAINPDARVSVKLAAVTGIGTIAAGVVKAGADVIEIDGLEGSTGASPRSSLEHTGLPTELGLREVHVALTELGLRSLVRLRAGGGIKTERDVVKYMMLGADEVTLATVLMIAQGCIHCNCCHIGTCPTEIAGQLNPRAHYPGGSEHVERFLRAFGRAFAELVAKLGFSHPREMVGRVDGLRPRTTDEIFRGLNLDAYGFDARAFLTRCETADLSFFTTPIPGVKDGADRAAIDNMDHHFRDLLAGDKELMRAAREGRAIEMEPYSVRSCNSVDFSVPVSHVIATHHGRDRWPAEAPIRLRTFGTAGQSYGAWCVMGLDLVHEGSCNDGVAKGMSGGRIVVKQPAGFAGRSFETTLVGNTVAFGATGGKLFIEGRAGQRLGVRNSGATIVCEGAGQYACEYMTNGVVMLLGPVGEHIGAGMTDGKIFIYDPDGGQDVRFTIDDRSVALTDVNEDEMYEELVPLLDEYIAATGSARALEARQNIYDFMKVIPISVQVEQMKKRFAMDVGSPIAG
ncbi:glutamate synthase large subunit [bacterium]|nr:glutamate synthase large subunit [bacterium]